MTAAELDIEQPVQLASYLQASGRLTGASLVRVDVLAGGVSSRTVRVGLSDGREWVLKQSLPKLRVAVDWFSDPARIAREAAGLAWLARLAPPGATTPLVFFDEPHALLAMQAVPEPHANWKTLLLAGRVEADHVRQFGALLGTIHRAAAERAAELEPVFADRRFFESLRVEPYFEYTATQVPAAAEFLRGVIADVRARRLTLVHGDYSPKNVLVSGGRLVLLDHEVIHWGDPAFDLAFALTHFLSKARHLPEQRRRFLEAAQAFYACYIETAGAAPFARDVEPHAVRQTLACLLARVRGRSPLEYLSGEARDRQAEAVTSLLPDPPETVADLCAQFARRLT